MRKFQWISILCILSLVFLAGCKVWTAESSAAENIPTEPPTALLTDELLNAATDTDISANVPTATKISVERKGSLVVGYNYAAYLDENGKLHILYDSEGVTKGVDLEKKYTGLGMDRSTLVTIDEEGKLWGYYIFTAEEVEQIGQEALRDAMENGGNYGTGSKPDSQVMRSFAELSGVRRVISNYPMEYIALLEDGTLITHYNQNSQTVDENFSGIKEYTRAIAGGSAGIQEDGTVVFEPMTWDILREKKLKEEWPSKLKQICSGSYFAGLKEGGTVIAEDTELNYLINTVEQWSDITYLAAASDTIVGLKSDGTVVAVCKLGNDKGQCAVTEWKDIVAVDTNGRFTVGIKKDGTVVATGELLAYKVR